MNGKGYKLTNDYQRAFGSMYADTPKSVFAAVAFSLCLHQCRGEGHKAVARFVEEWVLLFENGIVPQKPPAWMCNRVAHLLKKDEEEATNG